MIIKLNNPRFRSRVALFDFDWTLVKPKDNKTFPKDIDDWEWLRPCVPEIVTGFYKKGFGIYIFTNQSKAWKQEQIVNAMTLLGIPVTICIAFEKSEYKPSITIAKLAFMHSKHSKVINTTKSFMCGDAAGRVNDHSNSDVAFAHALNIPFVLPEDVFKGKEVIKSTVKPSKVQEVVVLVGYPGSGKSKLCDDVFGDYFVAHGDELKTTKNMLKAAAGPLVAGKSIVFDATNATVEKRKEYIDFARIAGKPCRCIHVVTSFEESLARNNKRDAPVPKIVYYVYRKKFEEPTVEEGFVRVEVV